MIMSPGGARYLSVLTTVNCKVTSSFVRRLRVIIRMTVLAFFFRLVWWNVNGLVYLSAVCKFGITIYLQFSLNVECHPCLVCPTCVSHVSLLQVFPLWFSANLWGGDEIVTLYFTCIKRRRHMIILTDIFVLFINPTRHVSRHWPT